MIHTPHVIDELDELIIRPARTTADGRNSNLVEIVTRRVTEKGEPVPVGLDRSELEHLRDVVAEALA